VTECEWEQEVLRVAREYREHWKRCVTHELEEDAAWKNAGLRVLLAARTPSIAPTLAERLSGEPKTTDYCAACGESPDSGSHLLHGHAYVDQRTDVDRRAPQIARMSPVDSPTRRREERRAPDQCVLCYTEESPLLTWPSGSRACVDGDACRERRVRHQPHRCAAVRATQGALRCDLFPGHTGDHKHFVSGLGDLAPETITW